MVSWSRWRLDERSRRGLILLLAVIGLGLLANHSAYRGYFEDDDLDTLTWARLIPLQDLVRNIPSLKYPPEHSRPPGYFYYGALFRTVGLNYPPWVAVLQFIHIVNIVLLWLLLRRAGFADGPAVIACLFFAFHRALFDAWWKPMFIYDVLCTTFALASVLAYAHRRWVLSFVAFWLALRTKEIGLFVPAILACYEMLAGERKWKRLVPFFVPALIYGGYGLVYNLRLHAGHPYGLHARPGAIAKSLAFYFSKMFWIPYAGFLLFLASALVRDRRLYFGLAAMLCGLAIYLLLPDRLLEIYLYLPLAGAAFAVAALANRQPVIALVAALIWIPWQYISLRHHALETLAAAEDRRSFVAALRDVPDAPLYVYGATPASLHSWGIEGGLRLFHPGIQAVRTLNDPNLPPASRAFRLEWDTRTRRLTTTPLSK